MKSMTKYLIFLIFMLLVCVYGANAAVLTQCPATLIDPATGETNDPNIVCKQLTAGDGFIKMADGADTYVFGFSDVTGIPDNQVMNAGMLMANFSAPTLVVREGQNFYLTLTNVGMMMRPDLFDPHTVHFHGFPNASSVFDGEPMASIAINMGNSITYYYQLVEPGTHMYHCHVEASEHMQMGMLGNLYVLPAQDGTLIGGYTKFAYNDGDGSTGYDVAYPIQMVSFDPNFHEADLNFQPPPFAVMKDTYTMLNGRGYPDTVNTGVILNLNGDPSQKVNSLITAAKGQKILLRISSLSTTDFYTLAVLGIPMKVVGSGARILRGGGVPTGKDLYYNTNSVTLGGGESTEVILDTTDVDAGTYFLYTTNLNDLSNNDEDFGGMMTEIVITP
jgi:FtsP/CotA-like multicopper oxidase with cupredoxin domain